MGPDTVLAVFVLFCRIGGCLLAMPGFSSARVPMQVRLMIALAITLALTPPLIELVRPAIGDLSSVTILKLVVSETLTGLLIGMLGRLFFVALQFAGTAIASYVGFSAIPGTPIEDNEPVPALVSLITLVATMLIFVTDQHWEVFRALAASYKALPPGSAFSAQPSLIQLSDRSLDAFLIAFRISSPFLIYAVIVNLAIGLTNKLTPQIPVFFISLPFVLAGGLLLLYVTSSEFLHQFILSFSRWLRVG